MEFNESILLFGGARYLSLRSPALPTENFTISFRFRSSAPGSAIFYGDYDFNAYTSCFFSVTVEDAGIRVRFDNNVPDIFVKPKGGGSLLDNQVHYIAVTVNENTDTGATIVGVFIDGNMHNDPQPISLKNNQGQPLTIRQGSSIFIATAPPRGQDQEDRIRESDLFPGTLTDLNMWSAVLSADDLVQDVKTSIPIRENVLCFRLPLDSDSYDYQANAFVDGSVNQINAQSSIMPDSNHCFSGSTDFTGFPIGSRTFETWIRCGMDAWGKTLLSYGDVSRSEHPNEGGDAWIIRNPEALQVNQMSTQINVADGQWHHLAIVTEVTAGTEPGSNTGKDSVYLDGVLKYSGNSQQVNQIANQPFLIGSGYWDDNEQVFQGQLKNAKLWLTPRSAAQIADSYQLAPFNAQQEAANGLLAYWTFTQGGADFGPALPYGITRYSKDVAELANDDELVASETPVLTVTTELMENYKHAQVMEQQHAFQALQTAEGHALFFSIGTDNTFYVTIETPGSKTGWNKINLSGSISQSALEKSLYQPSLFRVAQDVTSGAINIVLVLGGPLGDYVYTAWNLSNNDATWNEPLTWQYQKFDAPVVSLPMVKVHDVQLLESAPSDFLVVDIVLPVIESGDLYRRYFLDLKPGADTVWKEHDLALDFDNAIYSAIGKRAGETLEGIYTLGAVVDRYKLIYTPLIADASNTPNPASELLLPQPEGTALSSYAIALAPKGSTGETNLFVAGNKQLFFFASNQQQDGSTGQAVDLPAGNIFMNVSQLRTHTTDTHVFVWGLNQQGSLFYTQCALGQELEKQAWSTPGIILSGVSMAANYLNSANQSHVLFAYNTANQLLQLTQDGETPNWAQKTILLPAMDTNDVIELNTYTSHVVVTDGNRLPKAGVTIAITATTAVPVYVNDIYTILSPALPLNITTDSTGVLTIIQETPDLSAVGYRFKIEEVEPQLINPMAGIFDKLDGIKTGQDLKNVRIPDDNNSPVPLIDPAKVDDDTVAALVKVIQQLKDTVQTLPADGSKHSASPRGGLVLAKGAASRPNRQVLWGLDFTNGGMKYYAGAAALTATRSASSSPGMVLAAEGIGEEIIEDLTSFFSWVIDKGSTVLQAIEDFTVEIIGDVIGFVFKIAGKIFIFWIDCLVAAGSALLNFLDWVGVDTRKVRKWLGYIFNWDDILLTHRVFKSFFTTFIDHGIQSIESYEEKLLAGMTEMEDFVKDWAGIGSRLPDAFASDSARNISAGGKPISGQDSPAFHLLNYHLKNNAGSADLPGTATSPGIPSEPGSMFSILEAGIAKLRQNFYDLMNSLDEAAYSKVGGLSFKEIIVKLTGFIGAELIEIARTIMAELFKLFNTFLEGIRDILVLPMEIPVLSYLYKSKATKGDDLSILDVACLMAAVPATVAFKIGTGANVFTAQEAEKYIQATDFSVFQADFSKPKTIATRSAAASTAHVPGAYEKWVLATAVIASVSALGLIVTSALSKIPNVEGQEIIPNNPATILTGVLYLPYVAPSIVAWFGPEPLELSDSLNIVFVSATTLKALIDVSAAAQPISATQGTWQKASSWIDLALNGLWMIPSIMACAAEKNKNPTPTFQEATAGSFFFDFSGMLSPVLVYVKNPYAMAGAVIANAVFNILYANLNGAASMRIYEGLD